MHRRHLGRYDQRPRCRVLARLCHTDANVLRGSDAAGAAASELKTPGSEIGLALNDVPESPNLPMRHD